MKTVVSMEKLPTIERRPVLHATAHPIASALIIIPFRSLPLTSFYSLKKRLGLPPPPIHPNKCNCISRWFPVRVITFLCGDQAAQLYVLMRTLPQPTHCPVRLRAVIITPSLMLDAAVRRGKRGGRGDRRRQSEAPDTN